MHRQILGTSMRFDDGKTETLNLRVSPTFKQTLKIVADSESRSMVNMLEVILIDHCERNGWLLANESSKSEATGKKKKLKS